MSGGSYDYLFTKSPEEFGENRETILRMVKRFIELGYEDVALDTFLVLTEFNKAFDKVNAKAERLRDVWKALEWLDSNDTVESDLREDIRFYRELKTH